MSCTYIPSRKSSRLTQCSAPLLTGALSSPAPKALLIQQVHSRPPSRRMTLSLTSSLLTGAAFVPILCTYKQCYRECSYKYFFVHTEIYRKKLVHTHSQTGLPRDAVNSQAHQQEELWFWHSLTNPVCDLGGFFLLRSKLNIFHIHRSCLC